MTDTMTAAQVDKLTTLCQRYGVDFDPSHYTPQFDLPTGWVAGWVGGAPTTIYVGVSPEGDSHS